MIKEKAMESTGDKAIPDEVSVDLSEASSYQPSYGIPDPASMCNNTSQRQREKGKSSPSVQSGRLSL